MGIIISIFKVAIFIMLIFCGYTDIKKHIVYTYPVIIMSVLSIVVLVIAQDKSIFDIFTGVIPVLIFVFISCLTKEQLGYGDCLVILLIALNSDLLNEIYILLLAFFFAFIYASFLFIVKRSGGKRRFAFIPFLAIGYILVNVGKI